MERESTESVLARSLRNVLRTKPYAKTTVTDIVADCKASRRTFYNHFFDKNDLVLWIFKSGVEARYPEPDEVVTFDVFLERNLGALNEMKDIAKSAIKYEGQNSLRDFIFSSSVAIAERSMRHALDQDEPSEDDLERLKFFLVAGVNELVEWIVSDTPNPPATLIKRYRKLTPEGVEFLYRKGVPAIAVLEEFEQVYQNNRGGRGSACNQSRSKG